jgi:hypothetical protein
VPELLITSFSRRFVPVPFLLFSDLSDLSCWVKFDRRRNTDRILETKNETGGTGKCVLLWHGFDYKYKGYLM